MAAGSNRSAKLKMTSAHPVSGVGPLAVANCVDHVGVEIMSTLPLRRARPGQEVEVNVSDGAPPMVVEVEKLGEQGLRECCGSFSMNTSTPGCAHC